MTDPIDRIRQIEQQARERQDAQPVTLPAWPDSRRACPSVAFRSALFPALGRVKRCKLWDEPIYAAGPVTVTFRGEQLDQTDLDVYLELLHRFGAQQSSHVVEITAYALLRSLGKRTGSSDYRWLDSSLRRLVGGLIEVMSETRSQRFRGHLVESTTEDVVTGAYRVTLNRDFARMFRSHWSSLDIAQRRALRSPSAKCLHAYLSSHRMPGRHKWETLASVAGISGKNARGTIRTALDQMRTVGFLSSWAATDDGVSFAVAAVDNLSG